MMRYWVHEAESDEEMVGTYFMDRGKAEAVAEALNDVSEAGGLGRPYEVRP